MAKWTKKSDIEAAIALLDEGHTQLEVSELLGVTQGAVASWWKKHRPDKVHPYGCPRPETDRKRYDAMLLVLSGKGIVESAKEAGAHVADFSKWLKREHPQVNALAKLQRKLATTRRHLDAAIVAALRPDDAK